MNVFELIVFTLLCAALGFLGHLVLPRWGRLVGFIPWFVIIGFTALPARLRESIVRVVRSRRDDR
jgi:uncharacterized membrane protein (DUF4010 family)